MLRALGMGRSLRSASICILATLLAGPAGAGGLAAARCGGEIIRDVVRSVSADGEIGLASGRRIILVDVRLVDEAASRAKAMAWLGSLAGEAVAFHPPAAAPDRWDRLAGTLELTATTPAIDIGELLVTEGLARVDSGERDGLCRPDLLRVEAEARRQARGVWAVALPVAAGDLLALEGGVGGFAVVEGRVRSVGERAARTYLNFGRFGEPGFTVTVPKRSWRAMRERGLSGPSLRGRDVRVRGLLQAWRGVSLEIVAPELLEVLPEQERRDARR
jgi:hypothetical protein